MGGTKLRIKLPPKLKCSLNEQPHDSHFINGFLLPIDRQDSYACVAGVNWCSCHDNNKSTYGHASYNNKLVIKFHSFIFYVRGSNVIFFI